MPICTSGSGEVTIPARGLAQFVAGMRLSDVPKPVRERALQLMLDAVGVGLAARRYPFAERTLAGAIALGGDGASTVIGHRERLPLRDAALVNGVLLHGLDFDDSHLTAIIHPTVTCLPAAFGVAEAQRASGADMLAAYIAGMECAIRIGASREGRLPPRGLPRHRRDIAFQLGAGGRAVARSRRRRARARARRCRLDGRRRAGVPRGGRLDQAPASGLGRGCRHHRGDAGEERLLRPLARLRGPLRPVRDAPAGLCRGGGSGAHHGRPRQRVGAAQHLDQALPHLPFHPRGGRSRHSPARQAEADVGEPGRDPRAHPEGHAADRGRARRHQDRARQRLRRQVQRSVRGRDLPAQGTHRSRRAGAGGAQRSGRAGARAPRRGGGGRGDRVIRSTCRAA